MEDWRRVSLHRALLQASPDGMRQIEIDTWLRKSVNSAMDCSSDTLASYAQLVQAIDAARASTKDQLALLDFGSMAFGAVVEQLKTSCGCIVDKDRPPAEREAFIESMKRKYVKSEDFDSYGRLTKRDNDTARQEWIDRAERLGKRLTKGRD